MATINGQLRPISVRDRVSSAVAAAEKADPPSRARWRRRSRGSSRVVVEEGAQVFAREFLEAVLFDLFL